MFDYLFLSVILIFYFSLMILSFYESNGKIKTSYLLSLKIVFLVGFFVISISVTSNYSPDFSAYTKWFKSQESIEVTDFMDYNKDPAFFLLSKVVSNIGGEFIWLHGLFLIFILVSLYKILSHKVYENYTFLSLLILFCMFFIIHEVIQIRIAVAISFGLLSFLCLYDDKKFLGILFFILGITFHLAGIFLVIPFMFYFFSRNSHLSLYIIITLILFSVFLYLFQIEYKLIVNFLPDFILRRSESYLLGLYKIKPVEIFTSYNLVKLTFITIFLIFYKNMDRISRATALITTFNFVVFLIFKNNDSIALRYTQYFSLFDILFYVSVLRSFSIYEPYYNKIRIFAVVLFSVGGFVWLRSTLLILNDFDCLK